ncbi:SusC/RagA family TonB-linked outer membrane protein [Parapedobacter sp. 2B3]|uniref:SusC/RagA family TonB-linked outer membrane protein n=1 Tax=Parapedobacter sp. 2B3 TaxID=3342381 RepID=UPI0035B668AF
MKCNSKSAGSGLQKRWHFTVLALLLPMLLPLESLPFPIHILGHHDGANNPHQEVISGVVTDEASLPLEGVTVTVINTGVSSATTVEGAYSIVAAAGDTLRFSAVGYSPAEIEVGNRTVINVTLQSDQSALEEVVIVGYGTQKKSTLTGAIASISTKEIKQSPAANLAVTLAGRLPGLTAIQRSGEPGRDLTQLFVRGQGTINAQNPIILVDGIERDLTYIDPNEIESITILKDASSTAIFGVRGANGVILVTTKRGTSDVPEISFTTEVSAQDFPRFPSLVSSYDYARTRNLMQRNDGMGDAFSEEILEHYRLGDDPVRFPNTDWKGILLRDYSTQQRYNFNVSGAGQRVNYFVNAGYLNQGGMFNTEEDLSYNPSFKLDRYNFRSNVDIRLTKSLKAMLNLGGYLEKQNMPAGIYNDLDFLSDVSPALHILAQLTVDQNATVPGPLTPEGEVVTWQGGFYPPYGSLNRSGYVQQTRNNIMATFGLEQDLNWFVEGLSAKAWMSFDSKTTNNMMANREYLKLVQIIEPTADGGYTVRFQNMGDSKTTPLSLSGARYFTTLSNFQGYLNYANSVGKHNFTGLLMYQQQKNIIDAQLPYNLRGISNRITYGYDSRYFAEFNMGYNGSEQFKKGRRFGFFPAFSVAWMISNESFMDDVSFLNNLKVRASYGRVGNDRIGSRRFLYLDDVQVGGGGYSSSLGLGQRVTTRLLKNEALQWEVANKVNVGVDLKVFNTIDVTVDVYQERRDNILRNRGTIPVLNGLPTSVLPPVNIGVVENKGYEIELNYKKAINSDLSILGKLNLNYATNRQVFADEPLLDESFAYQYRQTGFRIGQNFGYLVDRYFTDEEDIANSPKQNISGHEPRPGDFKYVDVNNDNVVDEKDVSPIGYSSVPEYQFGVALNVVYKAVDVSVLLQGVSNVSQYYGGWGVFSTGHNNFRERHLESWTEERVANGDPIRYPRLTTQTNPNEIQNSFFINDGSYLRIKNVEIGYTFPQLWSKKIGAKNLRLYANGLNLVTWDRLPVNDFDPEVTSIFTYPITRMFNFGVNFIF